MASVISGRLTDAFGKGVDGIHVPGNLGPDICDWDYRTPLQSEKYPGWIDGIWYGIRKNDFVEGVSELESFHNLEGELRARGWSDTDLDLLLGKNLLRVYREILQ